MAAPGIAYRRSHRHAVRRRCVVHYVPPVTCLPSLMLTLSPALSCVSSSVTYGAQMRLSRVHDTALPLCVAGDTYGDSKN